MGPIVISKSKLPIIVEIVAAIITDGHIQARLQMVIYKLEMSKTV